MSGKAPKINVELVDQVFRRMWREELADLHAEIMAIQAGKIEAPVPPEDALSSQVPRIEAIVRQNLRHYESFYPDRKSLEGALARLVKSYDLPADYWAIRAAISKEHGAKPCNR